MTVSLRKTYVNTRAVSHFGHYAGQPGDPSGLDIDAMLREAEPECYTRLGYLKADTQPLPEEPMQGLDDADILAMYL